MWRDRLSTKMKVSNENMEDGSGWAPTDIGRPKLRWSEVKRKDMREKQPIDIEDAQHRRTWRGNRPKKKIKYYIMNEAIEFVAASHYNIRPKSNQIKSILFIHRNFRKRFRGVYSAKNQLMLT